MTSDAVSAAEREEAAGAEALRRDRHALHETVDRVVAGTDPHLASPARIAEHMSASWERFHDAPIREYLPILVEREVHAWLAAGQTDPHSDPQP